MNMDAENAAARSLLRFADEVKARFAFLEAKGFRCTHADSTLVRFESVELAINIFHGQYSYEISLQIENSKGSDSYSFSEILRVINNERAEQYRDYATHTVLGVAEGVRQLAELFRQCMDAGILSDKGLFFRLKLQRESWIRNYGLETQLELACKRSESAWAEKDFAEVVRVLTPLQEHLSPCHLKKLQYAKRHSSNPE